MRRSIQIAGVLAAVAIANGFTAPVAAAAEKPAAPDQTVTLATAALPVVFDGQVVNYVLVSVKLLLTPRADSFALRDKEPYFRDALVRAAHRTPFVRAGDYNYLDEGKLKAAIYREATAIAGPGEIQAVVVISQSARHRLASPRHSGGAAIIP